MAHLIFIAKNRDLASFRLTGPAVLGRSVECDIYAPDVFVSRQHCRFEKAAEGWVVIDQRSRNGIYYNGRRVYRRLLKHGDLIEIGSFSARFHQGDIPENLSTMTPFGEGTTVASLMDTLFTGGLRPTEYLRKSQRKPAWIRAREEAEAAARRLVEEAAEAARIEADRLNFSDGCELDLELQIAQQAESGSPKYVLVSREMLARFEEAMRDGGPITTSSDASDESIVASPDARSAAALEASEVGALSIAGVSGNGRAIGPGLPSGNVKNLWENVYKEVENPDTAKGGKKKKKDKEELKAAKEAARQEKQASKKSRPDVEFQQPIGERIKDFYEWSKTVDVSVGGLLTLIQGNPKPFIIAASLMVLLGGGWGVKEAVTPKYYKPHLEILTPAQRIAYEKAAKEQ